MTGQWRAGWTALTVACLARVVLAALASLVLWSLLPLALGWHPTVVMTGSMEPRLHPGDVVVSRPVATNRLRIGQILLVSDPDHPGRLRMHRLAAIRADGMLTLRGDANPAADSTPVRRSAVHGVAALRVPYIGDPLLWLNRHDYSELALLAAALAALGAAACAYRQGDDSAAGQPQAAPPWPGAVRRLGTLGLIATALVGTALATATPARAATPFSTSAANSANTWAAAAYFSCKAAVLANTPFLFYPLGEASGSTATDSSGNNSNGTYQGNGTLYGASGSCARDAGTAITLNGTSGYISTSDSVTNPTVFTTEIWFKTTTTSGGELIGFGKTKTGSSPNADRHLYLTDTGQVAFGVKPNGITTITSPRSYNDGNWHLADASLSGAGMQLYLDGQLVASDSTVTSAQNYTGYWRIGYSNFAGWGATAPTSDYVAATLDDAAVYTTALTATQIAAHYTAA